MGGRWFLLGLGAGVAWASLAVGACRSHGSDASAQGPDDADGGNPTASGDANVEPGTESHVFTMHAHVALGTDAYHCKYVVLPPGETFFVGASHVYSTGNHHLLVFRTDLTSLPDGGDVERDCFAPDDVMPHARAELYGAQSKTGTFAMPDGVGLPLHGGDVLLMQAHYLNATSADLDADVSLTIATRAEGVTTRAGSFYFADPFIDVEPGQMASARVRCLFPGAATILAASAYSHARATDFAAYVDPRGGPAPTAPFYRAPGFANPLPLSSPVAVNAGDRVRVECAYDNARGTTALYQGTRNDADEQCILSGLYYPDQGDDVGSCRAGPDEFGTGTAACSATSTCLSACPAGSAPSPDLGLGSEGAIDPCWQRCIARSCAPAAARYFALEACGAEACVAQCVTPTSGACASCKDANCASEETACAMDACK
jgi:hypothetical protein